MTRGKGTTAAKDANLRGLADCWAPVSLHRGQDLGPARPEGAARGPGGEPADDRRIGGASCAKQGKRVHYDAEHFFDAYAAHPDYALECLRAAAEAGAEAVTLCDTNGAMLPMLVGEVVERVVSELGATCRVAIHAHNDGGCAVANSLVAVARGADVVQGTINGYGERCGNADLCAIIPDLKLKMGIDCISGEDLAKLTDTAHFVAELCNVSPDPHQPYVGVDAFAHKGGLHISAVERDPTTFQHIDPALVGNQPHVLVSELSGKATIKQRVKQLGYPVDDDKDLADRVLTRLKEKEHAGYHYEAADASFELLVRAEMGLEAELFHLEAFRIIVEKREDGSTAERGHRQGARGRRPLHRDGRGQRAGQRPGHGAAHGHRAALPQHPRHPPGQLPGAHPGRGQGHGRHHPGDHRLLRRPRLLGQRGSGRERRGGLVGGPRRLPLLRAASRVRGVRRARTEPARPPSACRSSAEAEEPGRPPGTCGLYGRNEPEAG